MPSYLVVQKNNHNRVHADCSTLERAEHWIKVLAPQYVAKSYFMDKTLTADSFEIMEKTITTKKPL